VLLVWCGVKDSSGVVQCSVSEAVVQS
jgi:hypothetical protein